MEVRLYLMVSQKKKQKVVLNPKGSYSVACKRKLQKNLVQQNLLYEVLVVLKLPATYRFQVFFFTLCLKT